MRVKSDKTYYIIPHYAGPMDFNSDECPFSAVLPMNTEDEAHTKASELANSVQDGRWSFLVVRGSLHYHSTKRRNKLKL